MTQPRTTLPPSSAVDLAVRALAGQGRYGAVSALADEHDVSRKTVYQLRGQASEALTAAFTVASVEAPRGSFTWTLTEADIERTVVALRVVTPSSIRDIVAMLPSSTASAGATARSGACCSALSGRPGPS